MRRHRSGVCVYCLTPVGAELLTVDHVIARSWYPEGTTSLRKWKVPACRPCNNHFSRVEGDTLRRLAFCLNSSDRSLKPILDGVKRSIDPRYGKSARDREKRAERRAAILRDMIDEVLPDAPGMLPLFERNFAEGSTTGIQFPARDLTSIGRKWIRGIHYCKFGDLIPLSAEIDIHFVSDDAAKQAFGDILEFATTLHAGPSIQILVFDAVEGNTRMTQYAFKIFKEFKFYGTVTIEL